MAASHDTSVSVFGTPARSRSKTSSAPRPQSRSAQESTVVPLKMPNRTVTAKPWTALVDSREQLPYTFDDAVRVERRGLDTGDYSVAGLERIVSVERKSLADYLGSITQGRDRFFRELQRLQEIPYRVVIVEASYTDILQNNYRSAVTPASVAGTTMAIQCDFATPVMWLDNRQTAQEWTLSFLDRAWRQNQKTWRDNHGC